MNMAKSFKNDHLHITYYSTLDNDLGIINYQENLELTWDTGTGQDH